MKLGDIFQDRQTTASVLHLLNRAVMSVEVAFQSQQRREGAKSRSGTSDVPTASLLLEPRTFRRFQATERIIRIRGVATKECGPSAVRAAMGAVRVSPLRWAAAGGAALAALGLVLVRSSDRNDSYLGY